MHIPDGFLDARVAAATTLAAGAALAYSLRRLRGTLGDRAAPLLGVTAASVFSAQMLNFPVALGTSGHLMGGVLAAVLVGPWAGLVVVAAVLIVQCFLFQDGGVLALGANVLNMGVIGSLVGYCIYAPIRRALPGRAGIAVGGVIAAWFSVLLAAIACSIQLAASGTFALGPTLAAMLGIHAAIGVGEAVITGLTLSFILRSRPDIIYGEQPTALATGPVERGAQLLVGGMAVAIVLAVFGAPLASNFPDGLEWATDRVAEAGHGAPLSAGFVSLPAPIPDYTFPGIHSAALATSAAGLVGTLITFAVAFSIGRSLGRGDPAGNLANVG